MSIDEGKYTAAIPAWCSLRTLNQHLDIGLCWSLVSFVERAEPVPFVNCYRCDLRNPVFLSPTR